MKWTILIIFLLIWWPVLMAAYLDLCRKGIIEKRLHVFDPITLAITIGISLITASIQARMARKNLKDFTGIPTNDPSRPIPYVAGSVELSAPALLDFGDFHRSKVTIQLPGIFKFGIQLIFNLLPFGYRYYIGTAFGICHGPGVILKGIRIDDWQVYKGSVSGGTLVVSQPGLWGQMGGTYAVCDFYPGSMIQTSNTYLGTVLRPRVPGYHGVSYLVWRGPSSGDPGLGEIKFSGYVGRTPNLRLYKFQVARFPDNLAVPQYSVVNTNEANFAEVLYELLSNEVLGIGVPSAMFDLPAWQAAAQTLFNEGMGCSLIWDNSTTIADTIQHLRDTIDCVIYSSISGANAGKLTIKLIRADYDVNSLMVVNPSNDSDVVSYTCRTPENVPNEIKVSYTDINAGSGFLQAEAIWQSLTNRQLGQTRNTVETSYPIGTGSTAAALATRDGLAQTLPIKNVELKANRQTSKLLPGDVFKFQWPDYDVDQIILRVVNIRLGNLENPEVVLECLEDRFSFGDSAFGVVSTRVWSLPFTPGLSETFIPTIVNATTVTPPVAPNTGDAYIVAVGGLGAWAGHDGELAQWDGTQWIFTAGANLDTATIYNAATQQLLSNTGAGGFAAWQEVVATAYRTIQQGGVNVLPRREIVNFIGAAIVDNPGAGSTDVSLPGGAAVNPTDNVIPYRKDASHFDDSPFTRVDANSIDQKNGDVPNYQRLSIYRNLTDATHWRRLTLTSDSTLFYLTAETLNQSVISLQIWSYNDMTLAVGTSGGNPAFSWQINHATGNLSAGGNTQDITNVRSLILQLGNKVTSGNGSPEGVVTAEVGSLYLRRDGGANTSLYVKESGSGNTGWQAK